MAITYVRDSGYQQTNGAAGTTNVVTWPVAPTAGHTLIGLLAFYHSGATPTITSLADNAANTYASRDFLGLGSNSCIGIFDVLSCLTTGTFSNTWTVSTTGANYFTSGIAEFAGIGSFDTKGHASSAVSGTNLAVTTDNPVGDPAVLLISGYTVEASVDTVITLPSEGGWAFLPGTPIWRMSNSAGVVAAGAYKILSGASGNQTATWGCDVASTVRIATIASYKPVVAGSTKAGMCMMGAG